MVCARMSDNVREKVIVVDGSSDAKWIVKSSGFGLRALNLEWEDSILGNPSTECDAVSGCKPFSLRFLKPLFLEVLRR